MFARLPRSARPPNRREPAALRPGDRVRSIPLPGAAAGTTVDRFLHTVRRRQARAAVLESMLLAAAVVGFGVALAGLLARAWPRGVRWVLVAAAVAAVGLVVERIWRHWTRAAGNPFRTARLVAARMPGVSLDLLAVLELRRAMAHDPSFSTELALAHLRAVDARTGPARRPGSGGPGHGPPGGPRRARCARRPGAGLCRVAGPDACACSSRSVRRQLRGPRLAREPITGDLEVLYQYPAYTGLSPRTVTSSGDLSGPKGTVVQLRTRADRTVSGAQLQLSTGAVVPLRVEHGRDLSGSLVLQTTGTYAVVFTGRTGREAARGPDFPLTVEPDAPPQVSILLPGGGLEVDPEQDVLLRWEASDDYGLSDLALVWTGPDGQSHRQKLAHDDGRKTSGQYRWQLSPLKLGPGDRVNYAVEALDNDAVDGPQKGTSREQTLFVYSAAEHRREALRRAAELWERLVAHLATRMEGPDRDGRKSEDKVRAQEPVDTSGMVLAGDLVGTARALARERDRNEVGEHAARRARMPTARGAAFAAAHRMADRVHRRAAVVRLAAQPALAAGLAQADVHVVGDCRSRRSSPGTRLTRRTSPRRHRDLRPVLLASASSVARAAGAAANLAAAARLHLDVVNRHAERDLPQRHAVARASARRLGVAAHHLVAGLQPVRREDVRTFPRFSSFVLSSAMRRRGSGRTRPRTTVAQTPSLLPLEVDDAVHPLVAAAAEADVTMPWLLRPPVFLSGFSSDFSGFLRGRCIPRNRTLSRRDGRRTSVCIVGFPCSSSLVIGHSLLE